MKALGLGRLIRMGFKLHRVTYGWFGGRFGTKLGAHDVLLLTARGRRSGKLRTIALSYLDVGRGYAVIGSYGGSDRDPAWALNLRSHPRAQVQVGPMTMQVEARETEGAEREELVRRFEEKTEVYRKYRERTDRMLPVFVLEPLDG